MFFDTEKKLMATRWLETAANRTAALSPATLDAITVGSFLSNGTQLGIASEEGRPMLLVASPVTHTNQSGPSRGWAVFGRWLDIKWLNETFNLVGTRILKLRLLKESDLSLDAGAPIDLSTPRSALPIQAIRHNDQSDTVTCYLPTLNPKVVAAIDFEVPVEILNSALTARNRILFWGIVGGIFLVVLPLFIFEWSVLRVFPSSIGTFRISQSPRPGVGHVGQ